MKISLLTIFLFMSAASLTSVSARVWKESENGQVLWDDNCHFVGYVMGPPRPSGADECGRICLAYGAGPQARPPCTHFTHIYEHLHEEGSGLDWLKKILKIPVHVQHNMREKNGHDVYHSQELLLDVNLITLRVNICHTNILAIT